MFVSRRLMGLVGLLALAFSPVPVFAQADDCAAAAIPAECQNQLADPNLGVCSLSVGPPNIKEICDRSAGSFPRHDCTAISATCQPLPPGSDAFRCQFATDNRMATTDGPGMIGAGAPCQVGVNSFQADTWYQYIAPCTGTMTIHNCGADSTYDSMLQIFSNQAESCVSCPVTDNSQSRACSDDNCGTSGAGSAVKLPVVENGCYTIRMGGWSQTGTLDDAATGISELDIGVVCDPIPVAVTATPAPPPHDRRKNRYISFVPNNGNTVVAFRVQKLELPPGHGFCVGAGAQGEACTGAPARGTCAAGQQCQEPHPGGSPGGSCWVQKPEQFGDGLHTAVCKPTPLFRVWNEPVVHVGDCEIIPVAEYEIYTNLPGPVEHPEPLSVETILMPLNGRLWGDIVGIKTGSGWTAPDQRVTIYDVLAILEYTQGAMMRPHFTAVNLQAVSSADPNLNAIVATADLLIAIRALAGDFYGLPSSAKTVDPGFCPPNL